MKNTMKSVLPVLCWSVILLCAGVCRAGIPGEKEMATEVVATVNGHQVVLQELEDILRSFNYRHGQKFRGIDEIKRAALWNLIDNYLVVEAAKKDGMTKQKKISSRTSVILDGYLSKILLQEEIDRNVTVSESDIEELAPKEWVRLSFLVVIFLDEDKARAALDDIVAGGGRLKQYFESHRAMGDVMAREIGPLLKGKSDWKPDVEEVLFNLEKGEISGVLHTRIGYMIAEVKERKVMTPQEIEDEKREIRKGLLSLRKEQYLDAFLEKCRRESGLKVFKAEILEKLGKAGGRPEDYDDMVVASYGREDVRFEKVRYLAEAWKQSNPEEVFDWGELVDRVALQDVMGRIAREKGLAETEDYKSREEQLVEKFVIEQQRENLQRDIRVTQEELESHYREFPEYFTVPEQVKVVFLWNTSQKLAHEASKRAMAGDDFNALIEEFSQGQSMGGATPLLISRGQKKWSPEFIEACFAMSPGETSPVVRAGDRYFVIKCLEKRPLRVFDLNEVKDKVEEELLKKKKERAVEDYLRGLREKAVISIREDVLEKVSPPEYDQDKNRPPMHP